MKAFLRTVLGVLVAILILVVVFSIAVYAKTSAKPDVKDHSWLVLNLEGEIAEYPIGGFQAQLFGGPGSHTRLLENLEKAAVDDRIDGVIFRVGPSNLGYAKLEELRGAVEKVQGAGKKVYAYSDYLSNKHLYITSACDEVFMPPSGYLQFTGASMGAPFVRGTLDKLGINPNIHQIEDYKSAAELVTRTGMSPEAREMYNWLMDDLFGEITNTVAKDRGMSRRDMEDVLEKALFMPEEAVEAGLIDDVIYWDELEEKLKQPDDEKLKTVSGGEYAGVERADVGIKGDKKIAIVHAQGLIHGGESGVDPIFGMTMGAKSVIKDLRAAMDDEDVVGVLFRVDSGGGEAVASDAIGRWVKAIEEKKPVVVSMVDVAGSGGYMVAHRINPIVACPNTITGSIGSITGKFNMREFYNKIGITYDFVTRGPHALIYSDYRDFTPEEMEIVAEGHWESYNRWVEDIAEHRGLTFEEVDSVGRGRVWTGRQAIERKLIDKLGGLDTAIDILKEKAEIPETEDVVIVHYPEEKDLIEAILSGELASMVKSGLAMRLRSYLLNWGMSIQTGWYVMPLQVR
jgi:protease-4